MTDLIDLRSDTLTRPSADMRAAMAAAEVGDDVYGEDPTINELQDDVAARFGHQAALFVPSGTMGNQLGIRTLVAPGEELLADADAHILSYEYGAAAVHGGVSSRTVLSTDRRIHLEDYRAAMHPAGWGTVPTVAIAVENTHNRFGGAVVDLDTLRALRAFADKAGIALHCDGARLWNAHVATGVSLSEYGAIFDTISVCLSKGLGAPVGSVLVSSATRIAAARILRKRLGGGMRQAGILAAAGLFAVRHNIERLATDHANARRIADALGVDPADVPTNIVLIDVPDAPGVVAAAAADGVVISAVGPQRIRAVTHLDVPPEAASRAASVLARHVARARS